MSKQKVWRPSLVLTPAQEKIDASPARFKVVKAGRRFGKTKYAVRWQIIKSIEAPDEDHYYIAPTYRMAHEIAWREFLTQLGPEIIKKKSERNLEIELVNGARICLKGSDNEDALRGRRLGSLVLEEAAFQKESVYEHILRPMLVDLKAPALFISSPKKGWFSRLFKMASEGQDGEYAAWHFTIYDNPYLDTAEIEKIRATCSDSTFRSEYLAEELDYTGQVYTEFDPHRHIFSSDRYPNRHAFPTAVGVDWGLDDQTGVVWMPISPEGYVLPSREHLKGGWDVRRHAEVISRVAPSFNIDQQHYAMDQSAFRREGATGASVAEAFKNELGFYFQRSYKGGLDYGVDVVKRFLRGDGETAWMYVSHQCPELIRAFNEWEWNQHEPDILAALRYGLVHAIQKRMTSLHDRIESLKTDMGSLAQVVGDLELVRREKSRLGAQWGWDFDHGAPIGGDLSAGYYE